MFPHINGFIDSFKKRYFLLTNEHELKYIQKIIRILMRNLLMYLH